MQIMIRTRQPLARIWRIGCADGPTPPMLRQDRVARRPLRAASSSAELHGPFVVELIALLAFGAGELGGEQNGETTPKSG
jgi:hypothetical protein